MRQLSDESVMRKICTVKTIHSNEFKQLVSAGSAVVGHGEEGAARNQTATPKLNEVSIRLYPIYAYPKTTQKLSIFPKSILWAGYLLKLATLSLIPKKRIWFPVMARKSQRFPDFPRATDNDKTRPFGTLQTKK